ncbi:MAG: hypothetical protein JNN07_24725 [Verrucomicrobiales bacterium]|nr:hypothetical protein [Verrucomicrobiales bacterium]
MKSCQLNSLDRHPGVAFAALLQLAALVLLLWLSQDADAHRRFHGHPIPSAGRGVTSQDLWARAHVGHSGCGHAHAEAAATAHSATFGSGAPCGSSSDDEDAGCAVQLFALGQMALFTAWCELPSFEVVELLLPLPCLETSPSGLLHLLPFSCGPPLSYRVS